MIGQKCHSCSTTETPEWRRGPDGARTLCNACGLRKYLEKHVSDFFHINCLVLDYSKLLKKGSIGVQTKNYLMAAGNGIGIPKASTYVTADAQHQLALTNRPTVNYPFILMGPKYSTYTRQNSRSIQDQPTSSTTSTSSALTRLPQPYYTQQLPSISSTVDDSLDLVNTTSTSKDADPNLDDNSTATTSSTITSTTTTTPSLPFPSLSVSNNNRDQPYPSNSDSNNNITTLRIYQWKQNQ